MPVVRSRFALVALSSILAAGFVACSLDWSARGVERDAGPEASAPDAPSGEAGGSDAGDAGSDSSGVDCVALQKDLAEKKEAARACGTIGGVGLCTTTVRDECDCKIVVTRAEPDTPTVDYDQAVTHYKSVGCASGCDASCPTPNADTLAPAAWTCAQQPDGIHCYP